MAVVGPGQGSAEELALRAQMPVVGLGMWELVRRGRPDEAILRAKTPEEAVELALGALAAG